MKILVRALVAAACLHFLASCGGAVSQDNASSKEFFTLQPGTAEAYAGVEMVFTITGGQPPYTGSSSNAVVAPIATRITTKTFSIVPQFTSAVVPVVISIFDSAGANVEAKLNVNPNIISNTLTITPQATAPGQPGTISCGSSVCSGGYGTVLVTLASKTQSVSNRPVRFEVEQGAFTFLQNTPSTLTGPTYSTTTDANGKAQALLRADAFAQSQLAILRVTDLATGSVQRASFSIVRVTDGSSVISVLPQSALVTSLYKLECPSGAPADYLVVGGAPPYSVLSSFPLVASLDPSTVPVLTDGGHFTATTGLGCPGKTLFTVTDSLGRTATATLETAYGTETRPTVVPDISVQPSTGTLSCGESASFTVIGGKSPFVASSPSSLVTATVGATPSDRLVTVTRSAMSGSTINASPSTNVPVAIIVSDGTSSAQITLSVKNTCP